MRCPTKNVRLYSRCVYSGRPILMRKLIYQAMFVLLGLPLIGQAQETPAQQNVGTEPRKDTLTLIDKVVDIFEFNVNRRAVRRDPTIYPIKIVIAPIVSYAPETNWGAGAGAKLLFKFRGSGAETRTSNMPIAATYTLNNQLLLYSGYTIFFNQEKYLLRGNIQYSKFPQFYYGIGNNTPDSNEELYDYSAFLLEPLLLRRITGKLFVGGGIRYYNIWNVILEPEGRLQQGDVSGYNGSRSVGVEFAVTYDSRNNVLNATKGMLVEFTHGRYGETLGSTQTFHLTKVDVRQYMKVFRHRDDILAFQLYGYFSDGDVPLIELGALGGNELMRGYYEGRFLDKNFIALQAEYRLPISRRIGAVAFVGAGDVADKISNFRLETIKPSFGVGLRFKIVTEENLNIRFDYGFGKGTNNYYFNVAEAF